jgi:hypothetical protein
MQARSRVFCNPQFHLPGKNANIPALEIRAPDEMYPPVRPAMPRIIKVLHRYCEVLEGINNSKIMGVVGVACQNLARKHTSARISGRGHS